MGRGVPSEGTPRFDVQKALLVAPVRLALGGAALAAAAAIDHSFGTAVAEAGIAAALTTFILVSPGGRRRPERLSPPPSQPRAEPWWRVLAAAMYPSTYAVTMLAGIALAFNRDLAAFLAGVLLGMGVVPLVALAAAR